MVFTNQCSLLLCKSWKKSVKKYLSVEPETLCANLILRSYSKKDFSRSKLNIKTRGGRIFNKLVV